MTAVAHHLQVSRHALVLVDGDIAAADEAWLVMHGYGMRARGILHWFRGAQRPGRILVAPDALSRFYQQDNGIRRVVGSWMTRDDREYEIADIRSYLDQVASTLLTGMRRVEVHGFSQGVPAAVRWCAHTAFPVDRLVCWGSPLPDDVASSALRAKFGGREIDLIIGERDRHYTVEQIEADAARLRADGVAARVHRSAAGHVVDATVLSQLEDRA